MNIALRKVGNSQAVIIPKAILSQLGLSHSLKMEIVENKIVLSKPEPAVRAGWAAAAANIAAENDDALLLDIHDEETEWVW